MTKKKRRRAFVSRPSLRTRRIRNGSGLSGMGNDDGAKRRRTSYSKRKGGRKTMLMK